MRVFLIPLLLILVLSIGFPIDTPVGDFSYTLLRRFGIDVSMTPITYDMSMMSDEKGSLVYEKLFKVKLVMENGENVVIDSDRLHFYRHKVPLNLYYEILGYGGIIPEGRVFLCRSFQSLVDNTVEGFMLDVKADQRTKGFNELQNCL
jgi:hypothetical protein